ncbi:OpgC domain-containing protein [Spartinivicinus poritis]|uniref:OpgC domain-containing protein n=1 Tax=Spartinivicinus poritis TaxID=2994640 RepID=A0ABT5UD00_9GAMM|nr:OpgC domain-containing protein [Spartinivicinus sp. A2-2]MDE1464257.1 OpgC domain-containing protein [Spartinivicinus sp. A2-2]
MSRIVQIDCFRGWMLLIMTVDHLLFLPFAYLDGWSEITYGFAGYVTAAEGFFLLSGLVSGVVFTKVIENKSFKYAQRKLWYRARELYFWHLLCFISAALIIFCFPAITSDWAKNPYMTEFVENPLISMIMGAFFTSLPNFLDIIPVYVLFLIVTPFILNRLVLGKFRVILFCSVIFWILAQLRPQQFLLSGIKSWLPILPWNFGYFEIFAWQLIFILGIVLGYYLVKGTLSIPKSTSLLLISLVFTIFMLCHRHSSYFQLVLPLQESWISVSSLGPLRLLNTVALGYVLFRAASQFPNYFNQKAFIYLGQHSLYVFTYHIIFLYTLTLFRMQISELNFVVQMIIFGCCLASLWAPAYVHSRWIARKKAVVYIPNTNI